MRVYRETIVFSLERVLDVTEVWDKDVRVYYGYNYRINDRGGWRIARRWDNSHGHPHIDVYDEDGDFKEKIADKPRTLSEIKEVIRVHENRGVWLDHRD